MCQDKIGTFCTTGRQTCGRIKRRRYYDYFLDINNLILSIYSLNKDFKTNNRIEYKINFSLLQLNKQKTGLDINFSDYDCNVYISTLGPVYPISLVRRIGTLNVKLNVNIFNISNKLYKKLTFKY
ncbi:hypothetical protein BpHYR1_044033 [Brachionus plicatilis]|uniref:Uncharacterized protein n=1 Tax=Brachionus plicatilis TaxID=10195 RepID=A0A3M7S0L3_BRAPC|nr:hypothetical protein BpHYR1_044033 [Brachionus plicatilis]